MHATLWGFSYTKQALAFLRTVQPKIRRQTVKRIEALATDPHPANCKVVQNKLKGEETVYRIRSGDYRVLYFVRDKPPEIVILDIDHRKDVYR